MAHGPGSRPTFEGQTAHVAAMGPSGKGKGLRVVRYQAPRLEVSQGRSGFHASGIHRAKLNPAFRALLKGKEHRLKRAALVGSVTFNRRFERWVYLWWENGKRHSRTIGTVENFPTKEAAWQAVRNKRTQPRKPSARSLAL